MPQRTREQPVPSTIRELPFRSRAHATARWGRAAVALNPGTLGALLFDLHTFPLDELGVDQREQLAAALANAQIDH